MVISDELFQVLSVSSCDDGGTALHTEHGCLFAQANRRYAVRSAQDPLRVCGNGPANGERVVFREGEVALAARASATYPGMFEPVEFRHRYLVDGGLVSNIPTDLLAPMDADVIVAVDVTADIAHTPLKSVLGVMNQAIAIQSERLAEEALTRAQVMIRPKMGDIGPMDLSRSDECIDAGIVAGRRAVPEIKRYILDKRFKTLLFGSGAKT